MDKVILAIGGAVIKTALEELREVIEMDKVEMLIHNGGSLFHDFQRATDKRLADLGLHSYLLTDLLEDKDLDREASEMVWNWIGGQLAPVRSITRLCEDKNIPILCFTALGCDFWQLFDSDWESFARRTKKDFYYLWHRMGEGNFHYILLGSAVIHPEVFAKAVSMVKLKPADFKADVVDFLPEQYRPKTRVAKYGHYYCMNHKEFLVKWINGEFHVDTKKVN